MSRHIILEQSVSVRCWRVVGQIARTGKRTELMCARARQGVSLTVLARVRPRAMPALVALAEAGARVLGFKWLHAKALWADSGRGLVMSANLEKHGLDGSFELGVRLDGERAEELRTRLER